MIDKAKDIAKKVHQNQVDKENYPYMSHIADVAKRVSHLGEKYEVVAWLHDTIEDAEPEYFKEEIRQEIINSFDEEIVQAVKVMTKKPGEDYFKDYLPRFSESKIAYHVKIADSSHNLSKAHLIHDILLQEKLRKKYIKVLDELMYMGADCEIPIKFQDGKWVNVNPIIDEFHSNKDYTCIYGGSPIGAFWEKGKRNDKSERLYEYSFDGPYVNYYSNGNKCLETNFINGILNGYTNKYYKNGNIELKGFIYSWDIHTSIEIIYEYLPIWGADPLYNVKGKLERFHEDGKIREIYHGDDCDILNLKQIYPKY
tara:strand:- start:80 stop:1015 length:936 start_codon:yes stop_codon:yes gene_type:complete